MSITASRFLLVLCPSLSLLPTESTDWWLASFINFSNLLRSETVKEIVSPSKDPYFSINLSAKYCGISSKKFSGSFGVIVLIFRHITSLAGRFLISVCGSYSSAISNGYSDQQNPHSKYCNARLDRHDHQTLTLHTQLDNTLFSWTDM